MRTFPFSTMMGTVRSPFDAFSIAFIPSALLSTLTYSNGTLRFA